MEPAPSGTSVPRVLSDKKIRARPRPLGPVRPGPGRRGLSDSAPPPSISVTKEGPPPRGADPGLGRGPVKSHTGGLDFSGPSSWGSERARGGRGERGASAGGGGGGSRLPAGVVPPGGRGGGRARVRGERGKGGWGASCWIGEWSQVGWGLLWHARRVRWRLWRLCWRMGGWMLDGIATLPSVLLQRTGGSTSSVSCWTMGEPTRVLIMPSDLRQRTDTSRPHSCCWPMGALIQQPLTVVPSLLLQSTDTSRSSSCCCRTLASTLATTTTTPSAWLHNTDTQSSSSSCSTKTVSIQLLISVSPSVLRQDRATPRSSSSCWTMSALIRLPRTTTPSGMLRAMVTLKLSIFCLRTPV